MKIAIIVALLLAPLATTMLRGAPNGRAETGSDLDKQKRDPIELVLQNGIGCDGSIVVDLVLKNNGATPLSVPRKGIGRLSYTLEDATGKVYNMTLTPLFELPDHDKDLELLPSAERTLRCELRPQHWFDAPCPNMSHTFFLPKGVQPFAKGESAWIYPVKLTAVMTRMIEAGEVSPEDFRSKTIEVTTKAEPVDASPR